MSSVFSTESLTLVLTSFLVFKLFRNVSLVRIAFRIPTGDLPRIADSVEIVFKLVAVIIFAAAVVLKKWIVTQSASISLFSLLFLIGSIAIIARYSFALVHALPTRTKGDPLVLLVQILACITCIVVSFSHGYPSAVGSVFTGSPIIGIGALMTVSVVLFKPVFTFHSLVEAVHYRVQSAEELIHSTLVAGGVKPSPPTRNISDIVARMKVAGAAPFVLLALFSPVPYRQLLLPVWGIGAALSALYLAPHLASCWESHTAAAPTLLRKFYLIAPFVPILLLSVVSLAVQAYAYTVPMGTTFANVNIVSDLVGSGQYWEAVKEIRSQSRGSNGILQFSPATESVRLWSSAALGLTLMVYAVQVIATIGYGRAVTALKKYS